MVMEIPELWDRIQAILEECPEGLTLSEIHRRLPLGVNQMYLSGHLRTMVFVGKLKMSKIATLMYLFRLVKE